MIEITGKKESITTSMRRIKATQKDSELLTLIQSSLESFRSTGYIVFFDMAHKAMGELYENTR